MKKLPVGIQDFRTLREGHYLYVDKTEIIAKIPQVSKYIFLSRPRRFGKSLLLSTLKELYLGNKDLFAGLWIEDNWQWESFPVIYIDLNMADTRQSDLETSLHAQIHETATHYNIQLERKTSKDCFAELLVKLSDLGKKVVVLIDEYDKPITDYLNISEKREEHVKLLKGFYGTIKSYDNCIQQTVISGVSRYGKVSIFSDLNNLKDITLNEKFNNICGYTQSELESYFSEFIDEIAVEFGGDKDFLLMQIRFWYNGYSWNGRETVYNPFSVLNFMGDANFENYWFETGTPTFLMEMVKEMKVMPQELNGIEGDDIVLESADVNNIGIISLLYQTGYLTIREKHNHGMRPASYTLGFPNEEVRLSFQRYLLAEYLNLPPDMVSVNFTTRLRKNMEIGNWAAFFEIVDAMLATIPYSLFDKKEKYFHSLMHVLLASTGYQTFSEVQTNFGRMDTVITMPKAVFIFEFKINKTADEAIAQIKNLQYPMQFAQKESIVTIIGVSFDTENRKVGDWKTELV